MKPSDPLPACSTCLYSTEMADNDSSAGLVAALQAQQARAAPEVAAALAAVVVRVVSARRTVPGGGSDGGDGTVLGAARHLAAP